MGRVLRKGCKFAVLCVLQASASVWAGPAEDEQLLQAAQARDPETALYALSRGAKVETTMPDGSTALHFAAHYGLPELVGPLLKAGADPQARNQFGVVPLAEAAAVGNEQVIAQLLKAGADPEARNPEGQTALMLVARTGRVAAAEALLKAGAKVDAREQWGGQTALMWAAAQGHAPMVRLLARYGADVNARGAVRDWQRRMTAEPRPKGMNRGGFTPLLYAAREGCIDCARELLKAGADINRTDPERTSPLLLALLNLRFDLAAVLLEAGADVDLWDLYGQSPLYVAIDMNVLPRGGRVDLPSEDRLTGLDVARLLLAKGANPNLQLKLRPPYRNYIYDRGGDAVLSTGATPLLRAAKGGDNAAVQLLLEHKALVDLPNEEGVTPLMAAAGMGHGANPTRGRYKTDAEAAEGVRLLLAAGARVDATNSRRLTALHSAAQHGWTATVKRLVEQGAALEAEDARGLRPIDFAAGRYERAFLEPEPAVRTEAMALLRTLIVAAVGREPLESKGPRPQQTRGTGGTEQAQTR